MDIKSTITRMLAAGALKLSIGLVAMIALTGGAAQALPVTAYQNNFSVNLNGFVGGSLSNTNANNGANLTQFNGHFSLNNGTTLTVAGLPSHTMLSLKFDLYLFDTWDGDNLTWGKDYFSLAGDVAFSETFTNHQASQSYLDSPTETYGSGSSRTDVYRMLGPTMDMSEFLITHSSDTFTVTFGGPTTQTDESWGIDNVIVTIDSYNGVPVPEPATLTIFGIGLAGLGYMRRRRAA